MSNLAWRWLEDLAPLKGRWLRAVLTVVGFCLLLFLVSFGLVLTDEFAFAARGRDFRISCARDWRLSRHIQAWEPLVARQHYRSCAVRHRFGPLRVDYRIDWKRARSPRRPLASLILPLHLGVLGLGWLLGRAVVPREGRRRFSLSYLAGVAFLEFPMATACGPFGCHSMHTWHAVAWWTVEHVR